MEHAQEIAVAVIVALAAGWLVWKLLRRKSGPCGSCDCWRPPEK
jgi:hypothetical protein